MATQQRQIGHITYVGLPEFGSSEQGAFPARVIDPTTGRSIILFERPVLRDRDDWTTEDEIRWRGRVRAVVAEWKREHDDVLAMARLQIDARGQFDAIDEPAFYL